MGFRSGHHVSTHHVRETRNALHYIRRRYGALCAKPEQPSLPEHREETPQPEKNTDALSATHYAALFQDHVDQLQQLLQRYLSFLEERVQHERQKRDEAELQVAVAEDRIAFLDDNASLIIKTLKQVAKMTGLFDEAAEETAMVERQQQKTAAPCSRPCSAELNTSQRLALRENELELVMTQLSEANQDLLYQQEQLDVALEASRKVQMCCTHLGHELSQERRIIRALKKRIWQYELIQDEDDTPTSHCSPDSLQKDCVSPVNVKSPSMQQERLPLLASQTPCGGHSQSISALASLIVKWHDFTYELILALDDP